MGRWKGQRARLWIAFGTAALLTLAITVPALAINSVTQVITGGIMNAFVDDLVLASMSFSNTDHSNAGTLKLTANNSSGSATSWSVTMQSSPFTYSGANAGTSIPAANFSIVSANAPTAAAGQAIDPTGGLKVPPTGATGALNAARTVLKADSGFRLGIYNQNLDVSLLIPANSAPGSYSAALNVTISPGSS